MNITRQHAVLMLQDLLSAEPALSLDSGTSWQILLQTVRAASKLTSFTLTQYSDLSTSDNLTGRPLVAAM